MEDQISSTMAIPVNVLALTALPPVLARGTMVAPHPRACHVTLDQMPPGLRPGLGLVLDCGESASFRVLGRVESIEGSLVVVAVDRVVRPDKRAFPRIMGGVRLSYAVLSAADADDTPARWLAGEDLPLMLHEPDPFMDISGSGLCFEDKASCVPNDTLLLDIRIPTDDGRHRATARVIRLDPLSDEEREESETGATHYIAVNFLYLPPKAVEAFVEYTLRLQEATA